MDRVLAYGGHTLMGRQEEADYVLCEEPTQRYNAFIEALPRIFTYDQAARKIACYPIYEEEERTRSLEYRDNAVMRIASLVDPLPAFMDVQRRISRMIRSGYVCRNPITTEYVKQLRTGFPSLSLLGE